MSGSQADNPSSGTGCQAARLTTRPLAKVLVVVGRKGSLGRPRSRTLVIKSVVTESNPWWRSNVIGLPSKVHSANRLGDSGESMKTVRRHMSAGQKTKSDLGAEMPVEQRYGPVEHFVVTNGVWRRIPVEQKYRPAEHGSKPIPVYDARDYGDHVYDIVPR